MQFTGEAGVADTKIAYVKRARGNKELAYGLRRRRARRA